MRRRFKRRKRRMRGKKSFKRKLTTYRMARGGIRL